MCTWISVTLLSDDFCNLDVCVWLKRQMLAFLAGRHPNDLNTIGFTRLFETPTVTPLEEAVVVCMFRAVLLIPIVRVYRLSALFAADLHHRIGLQLRTLLNRHRLFLVRIDVWRSW